MGIVASKRNTLSQRVAKPGQSVTISIDPEQRKLVSKAARLRRKSLATYIREVTLSQAHEDIGTESDHFIPMTPGQQRAFWNALNLSKPLTTRQKKLGRIMRGES